MSFMEVDASQFPSGWLDFREASFSADGTTGYFVNVKSSNWGTWTIAPATFGSANLFTSASTLSTSYPDTGGGWIRCLDIAINGQTPGATIELDLTLDFVLSDAIKIAAWPDGGNPLNYRVTSGSETFDQNDWTQFGPQTYNATTNFFNVAIADDFSNFNEIITQQWTEQTDQTEATTSVTVNLVTTADSSGRARIEFFANAAEAPVPEPSGVLCLGVTLIFGLLHRRR